MSRVPAILLVLLFLAATWWTYVLNGSPRIGIDDANIFFSYAQNLAAGHGFIYGHNPVRVEGATSLVWTVICALVFKLGGDERAILAVNVALTLAALLVVLDTIGRVARRTGQSALASELIFVALVVASPGYVTWTTIALMDTSLWGLVLAVMTRTVLLPSETKWGSALATLTFAAAPAVRPEGMLVAPAMAMLRGRWGPLTVVGRAFRPGGSGGPEGPPYDSTRPGGSGKPEGLPYDSTGLVIVLAAIVVLTVFRLAYFGYPLPNTYYAKVSPSILYNLTHGARYVFLFLRSGLVVMVIAAALLYVINGYVLDVAAGVRRRVWPAPQPHQAAGLVALLLLAVPVVTGGDHFAEFRFYQPAYPLICLPLALWLLEFSWAFRLATAGWYRDRAVYLPAAFAVIVMASYGLYAFAFRDSWSTLANGNAPLANEFRIAEENRVAGARLAGLTGLSGHLPSVGVLTAGAVALTYPGPIVDLLGLSNLTVAHFRGDRRGVKNHAAFEVDAFFAVEPELLLMRPAKFSAEVVKGLFTDPRFTARWSYGVLARAGHPQESIALFARRDFVETLKDSDVEFSEIR